MNQLEKARLAFTEAIADIELLRDQVAGGELERQRFFESRVAPYLSMVELLVAQNRQEDALAYAERAKARVLLDVLRSGRVNVTKAMTATEKERERELYRELTSLNTQLAAENMRPNTDAPRLARLNARLEKARLDYTAFQTDLYAVHAELKVRRGEAPTLSLRDAAGLLPDAQTALLEYVVTERKTFLFVLTGNPGDAVRFGRNERRSAANNQTRRDASDEKRRDASNRPATSSPIAFPSSTNVAAPPPQLRVYTVEIERKELTRRAANFREQLAARGLGFRPASRELYDLLLKPAQKELQGKTRLVIVPDGELWDLPFQALQSDASKYLIENSEISYAQSLTVLREMMKIRARDDAAHEPRSAMLLAFGNPFLGDAAAPRNDDMATLQPGAKLAPLPEAERQVKALGEVYGHGQSKIYVGTTASERRLKAEAPSARILHLATHGILNDASPIYSHVLLSLDEGKDGEDGLLEAWEIMNLNLQTELVVLSACETARGKVGAGEGVIGMTWALFVAGSPTTIVSQWKVEEASTTELMLEFHRNFRERIAHPRAALSTAGALREAALKSLRSGKRAHPFYWAGFVVVGDGR